MKKEDVLKFYQNYRLYIFPIVIAFSCLILIIFVIYPQIVSLLTNQAQEKDFLNKSKFLEVKAQTLESYNQEDLSQKVNYALAAYPVDKDSVNAVGILQRVISQLGFNINAISLGSSTGKNANSQSYSFRVDLSGPITLLPSLLNSLESSQRLMRVTGLEVLGIGEAQGSNISLGVDLLYAAAPQGFGSIDFPLPTLSQKDEEVIAKLVRIGSSVAPSQKGLLGPRGKSNPFE